MTECKDCIHFEVCAYASHQIPICDSYAEKERHGRWIGVDSSYWRWSHDGAHTVEHITFRCSECARKSIIKTNYCPNCGAKMDGGAE